MFEIPLSLSLGIIKAAILWLWILFKWSWPILLLAFAGLYLNYRIRNR